MVVNDRVVQSMMDILLIEFEIDHHYLMQILVNTTLSFLDEAFSSILAVRPEDTHSNRSARGWLQRSQSHNEVNNDNVADRGRYSIREKTSFKR